jgi:hypothetical protein
MRTTVKPNCRGRQLGSGGMSFARRYQELTTHVFMPDGISGTNRGYDSVAENKTGMILYIGGTTMATVVSRGDA